MTLEVNLYGERVGVLAQAGATRVISFTLDERYFTERPRPVLGQMFEERRQVQRFRQSARPGELPAFFENLMPEGALRDIIRAQSPEDDALRLLARIGSDLPGAVTVRPLSGETGGDEVHRVFDEPPRTETAGPLWRFSLAGVQFKMSASRDLTSRFTLPFSREEGRWILKFGSPQFVSLPENEFAVMRWARRAGLQVPACELVDAGSITGLDDRMRSLGETVFAIERFDRGSDGLRIHQEDFAQLNGLHPDAKYEHATYEGLARVVGALCGEEDLLEFIRRLVFMVLSGNVDAHRKNWSLIYPDRFHPRLSPAYDLVFVLAYPHIDRQLALKLAGEKYPAAITWNHFSRIERFLHDRGLNAPVVDEARAFAARALDAWSAHRDGVAPSLRAALEAHLASLHIARS